MTEVVYELPEKGEARSASDGKMRTALTKLKETVNGKIGQANFEANAALAGKWYTPVGIATEESRESTSFGTLTTKDEITGVVVPANAVLLIAVQAQWKCSVAGAGRAAVFIGSNQLQSVSGSGSTAVQEATLPSGAGFAMLSSGIIGLESSNGGGLATIASTGMVIGGGGGGGGFISVSVAAGTYAISLRFRSTSGNVTAKERTFRVGVLGT